jgi:defect-in-organelle-trafficking protein DotC
MSRTKLLLTLPLLAAVSACAQGPATRISPAAPSPARADVNPAYRPGELAVPDVKVPTLAEMENLTSAGNAIATDSEGDKLRVPALRDAALSYGARGGLAFASKQINERLTRHAEDLSRTWDFSAFLIKGPSGVTVLPPVIVESKDTYEQSDAGKALRIADTYYQIVEQARFAPTAPLWHSYLLRTYSTPTPPPDELLPKSDKEREAWKTYVREGWERGVKQADDIFQSDLRRLERDFVGMVRYAQLLEQNQVTAPVIADSNLGVTGTGQDMRVNDRAMRITADPRLNVRNPQDWQAPVSGASPSEAATPPGGSPGQRDR